MPLPSPFPLTSYTLHLMLLTLSIDRLIDGIYALSAMRRVQAGAGAPRPFGRDDRAGLVRCLHDAFMCVVAQLPSERLRGVGPLDDSLYGVDGRPPRLPDSLWVEYQLDSDGPGAAAVLAAAVTAQAESLLYGQCDPAYAERRLQDCTAAVKRLSARTYRTGTLRGGD